MVRWREGGGKDRGKKGGWAAEERLMDGRKGKTEEGL